MHLPQHVVVVPDGNRRWARAKSQPAFLGHRAGAQALQKILETSLELKIPNLTVWGTSLANITERSPAEVKFLFHIFETNFKRLGKHSAVHKNKVRIDFLGRWADLFPASLVKVMQQVAHRTKEYQGYRLTFLMAYSGLEEMTAAVKAVVKDYVKNSKLEIESSEIKRRLWTKDLPPVDLVIRTGGEPHWSAGMLMWDVAEARLHFSKTLWPAFTPAEFRKILEEYSNTERRFGK